MSAIQTKNRFVPIILSAAVFLILVVTLLFTNVFRKPETIRSVEIQDHDWEFVLMMEQENVVACRENDMASYPSATPFDMQLRVSDDMITLTNEDTGEQQNITYKILQKIQTESFMIFPVMEKQDTPIRVLPLMQTAQRKTPYICPWTMLP